MMKKFNLRMAAVMTGTALLLTACNKESDPTIVPIEVSSGFYVVCGGNVSAKINGSLTYVENATGTAKQKVFQSANGRSLGQTPNDAVVYGSKMYIVVNGENTIEVVDAKTLKSIKQIKTTELMGPERGMNPRCIIAYKGCVYVSTYGTGQSTYGDDWSVKTTGTGFVAAIDTVTLGMMHHYTVGSFPEGMCIANDILYVANSDYSAITKASITAINLATDATQEIKNDNILNPTKVAVAGNDIYVLDMGDYGANPGAVKKISENKVTTVMEATCACFVGTKIIACNSPYGAETISYKMHDINTGATQTFTTNGVFSPNLIEADPLSNRVYIASYNKNPDTGYADYRADGYVAEYDLTGRKLKEYPCGVGANAIVFNTTVEYIEM